LIVSSIFSLRVLFPLDH